MKTRTATIGFEIPSPLTMADGLEYDATLEIEIEVEVDYAERSHWYEQGDITATDATVSVCGVDIPATAKAGELHAAVRAILSTSSEPWTSFEIAAELSGNFSPSRVRGALAEMVALGELLVDDLGVSEYGRQCSRYQLKR